jgi:hypothetical protein
MNECMNRMQDRSSQVEDAETRDGEADAAVSVDEVAWCWWSTVDVCCLVGTQNNALRAST